VGYKADEFIRQVESLFPVEKVRVNGEQIWPYLRIPYATYLQSEEFSDKGERKAYDMDFSANKNRAIKIASHGIRHWFGRYDYICIGLEHDRRFINGHMVNRFLDPVVDVLGRGRVLFIEQPTPGHSGDEQTEHLVSEALPLGLRQVVLKLHKKRPAIDNIEVLNAIQKTYGLKINDYGKVRQFQAMRGIWRTIFRFYKPRALFLTNYYGFAHPALRAAHDCGIPVVEIQHGSISRAHPAYCVHTELDTGFFADWLLVFGESEIDTFTDGRFIDPSRVVPVGSYYIDYVGQSFQPDQKLARWIGNRIAVGVALQLGFEKAMVKFVVEASKLDGNICYVLLPRIADNYLTAIPMDDNVMIYTDRDFCRIIPQFDFHATVSSTTGLEAPSLGVRNIIVDLDGDGRRNLGQQLPESGITRYVATPQGFVDAVRTYPFISKDEIINKNARNIKPGYCQNMREFLVGCGYATS
jgi:hypothetical protein